VPPSPSYSSRSHHPRPTNLGICRVSDAAYYLWWEPIFGLVDDTVPVGTTTGSGSSGGVGATDDAVSDGRGTSGSSTSENERRRVSPLGLRPIPPPMQLLVPHEKEDKVSINDNAICSLTVEAEAVVQESTNGSASALEGPF